MTTVEVRRNVADGGAYLGYHHAVVLDEQHAIRAVSAPLDALCAARLQAADIERLEWLSGGELAWARRQAWVCCRTISVDEQA
jgi:hypothetical protein